MTVREKPTALPSVRQPRRSRGARRASGWRGPFVGLLLLVALLACVGYAVARPAQSLNFPVDQLPLGVGLRNTYGIERNAAGPYVWTRAFTLLVLPVQRPGHYRLTLALQSSPAAEPRLVSVFANGQHLGTFLPDATARDYTLDWARTLEDMPPGPSELWVEFAVAPFLPQGDDRALGIILSRVALEPVGLAIAPTGVLLAWLGLAMGLLIAGQLGGIPWRWRNIALAGVVAIAAGLVTWDRDLALFVAAQPLHHPWIVLNGVAVAALAALAFGPFLRQAAAGMASSAPVPANTRFVSGPRALGVLGVAVALLWAAVIVGVTVVQATEVWGTLAALSRFNPRRVESLQFAGVIFAFTLLGVGVMRAVKPVLAVPTLVAIFTIAVVALAAGAGSLGVLALLLLLVASWCELGRWLLLLLGVLPRDRLEAGVLAFGLGGGCFALWVLLVGSLGWLYPLAVALPVIALVASLLARLLLSLRVSWPAVRRSRVIDLVPTGLLRVPSWFETVLLGLVAGFALIGCAAGFGPEVMSDAYRVHLAVARQFVAEHRVYGIADQRFSLWPIHGQLLYTAGMALGGPLLAKLIHTATGLAAIAAVGAGGRRLGRSRTAGIIAAALFAGLPVVVWELGVGYIDLFVTLYGVVALLCLLRLLASRDWRWALLLGLALGFGVAAKLTFGFLVVGACLALVVGFARRVPLRSLLAPGVALAAGLALTAGVWLLRSVWLTREIPGLSLLLGAIGWRVDGLSQSVGNLSDFGTGRSVASFVRLPWVLALDSSRFGENAAGFVGFAMLLLLPCLIALPRRRRSLVALTFVAVPFVLWFFTAQYTRYLLPTLAALTVVLGVAVARLHHRLGGLHPAGRYASRAHAAALSAVLLASTLFYCATFLVYPGSLPVRVVLGREEPEAYLTYTLGIYEATRYLDRLVAPGTAVAALPDGPGLYTSARLITPFGVEPGLIYADSIGQLRATLDRYGITYVLIEHAAIAPTWQNIWILRPEFLDAYADRVFTAGGATIYRLRPTEAVTGAELLRDGGFEAGAGRSSPWLPIGDAPSPGASTNQGRSAIAVTDRTGYYQAAAVQAGQGYRLRFAARSDQPGAVAEMRIDWFNSAGTLIESSVSTVPVTSAWANYALWHPAPAGAVTAVVYVLARNGTTCWFDDYSLVPAD